ncbi:MAG TPA: hypothetical protein VGD17_09650 [Chitinophagaceae bacterium]
MSTRELLVWILLVIEGIAFIASMIYFKRLKRSGFLFIPVLMAAIMVTEIMGKLTASGTVTFIKNSYWFNIMIPVQFTCLFLLFYQNTDFRPWRIIIKVFIGVATLLALYVVISGIQKFDTRNYVILATMVCACSLFYLYECMNGRLISGVYNNALFYLALGTLLFYMITLPLRAVYNYLPAVYERIFWPSYYLSFALNYIMYGLITFGIIWAKNR